MNAKCLICCKHKKQNVEPLKPTPFPEYPWQRVATDLFEWKKTSYILVVDYCSRYTEIASLRTTNSNGVIQKLKTVFARHGIPECLVSDNGPQFTSQQFQKFSEEYGFEHTTSSPNFPQANGEAERAVRTVKTLLSKNKDPLMALLVHRSTPLENGYSPAELLKLRTTVPVIPRTLQPKLPNYNNLREKEGEIRERQQNNFNRRHKAKALEPLLPGETVWIPDRNTTGTVTKEAASRSYNVQTESGQYRRNCQHIIPLPAQPSITSADITDANTESDSDHNESSNNRQDSRYTLTQSGRVSKPPIRFISSGLI